jgi:hypothetical protein
MMPSSQHHVSYPLAFWNDVRHRMKDQQSKVRGRDSDGSGIGAEDEPINIR